MRINPISKELEEHNGVDIANKEGTKIVAVADSIVTEIYDSPTYGKVVKYKLNDKDISILYAHNSEVFVEIGDYVKKGEVISTMGSTGYATGVHLHYAIYVDEVEVDPMDYLDLPYTEKVIEEYVDRGDILW